MTQKSQYQDGTGAGGGLENSPGVLLLTRETDHSLVFPVGKVPGQLTIFRAVPEILNHTKEGPWRLDEADFSYGVQVYGTRIVRYWGALEKFTFDVSPTDLPAGAKDPVTVFYQELMALKTARELPVRWAPWLEAMPGKGAPLDKPGKCMFLQGLLLQHGEKVFKSASGFYQPKFPCVLALPKSAAWSMETLLNTEKQNYTGDPSDYAARFAAGDLFTLDGGYMFQISLVGRTQTTMAHYEVTPGSKFPVPLSVAERVWRPWDQVMHRLTEKEIISIIARAFTPDAVDYVFGSGRTADMLPDHIRGSYAKMSSQMNQARGFNPNQVPSEYDSGYSTPPRQQQPYYPPQPPQHPQQPQYNPYATGQQPPPPTAQVHLQQPQQPQYQHQGTYQQPQQPQPSQSPLIQASENVDWGWSESFNGDASRSDDWEQNAPTPPQVPAGQAPIDPEAAKQAQQRALAELQAAKEQGLKNQTEN